MLRKGPETRSKTGLRKQMRREPYAAVGAPKLESQQDFTIWMQTMTAHGKTIDKKAVEEHLNDVKRKREAAKNRVSVAMLRCTRSCYCVWRLLTMLL